MLRKSSLETDDTIVELSFVIEEVAEVVVESEISFSDFFFSFYCR